MTEALKRQALDTAVNFGLEQALPEAMNYSIDPINREVLIKFQPSIADLNGKWCRSAIVQVIPDAQQ